MIDWFTVAAQTINFLILVWLLKRFFYRPILDALDAREKRIASELASAAAKERQAEAEHRRFQQKNQEFDRQRDTLLASAADEAGRERKRLMAAAHADADNLRIKRNEALRREYQTLRDAIERRTCAEVFAIARKVLADLANTTLEAHMAEAFIRHMRSLSSGEKASLASAAQVNPPEQESRHSPAGTASLHAPQAGENAEILVRSTFELPAAQREAIAVAIRQILGEEIALRFQVEPNLISGIELVAGGYKVTWSIAGYMASLEEEVDKLLGLTAGVESGIAPAPGFSPAGEDSPGSPGTESGHSGGVPSRQAAGRRTIGVKR